MANFEQCNGIIYLVTNKVNGKIYIGQTIMGIYVRWRHHITRAMRHPIVSNTPLHCAIRKYGADSFDIEIVGYADDMHALDNLERMMISILKSNRSGIGYNCNGGGAAGKRPTAEHIEKVANALRGKPRDRAVMERLWACNRGKKRSAETRAKIGAAHKGKKKPDHVMEALRQANLGRPGNRRVKVECLETGRIFPSVGEAASFSGEAPTRISTHLNHGVRLTSGYHFVKIAEESK